MAIQPMQVMHTPQQPLTIMFGGLKGGVAKSTSSWCVACELATRGLAVTCFDADPVSQSLYDSYVKAREQGEVPFKVIAAPNREGFPGLVDAEVTANPVDVVLFDTGGDYTGPFNPATLLADEIIAPVAPTQFELRRLQPTVDAIEETIGLTGRRPGLAVLLVKTRSVAADAATARQVLEHAGWPLMNSQVPDLVRYSRVFGRVLTDTGAYAQVVDELYANRLAAAQEGALS